ncbi:MAG: CDP-alcohol phosphatidyltransferase family protein [Candidatus Sungiibacteriota bacterium]
MKISRPLITALPSAVTSLRFIGLPFLVGYIRKEEYLFALGLFLALALTDFFDGVVARKFNAHSRFGKFLDPAADKFLLLPTLFYAMRPKFIFSFLFLAYYEAMLFLAACIAFTWPGNPFVKLGANWFGKAKAVSEIVLIALFLLARLGAEISQPVFDLLFFSAIIMAFLSVCGHINWKSWW